MTVEVEERSDGEGLRSETPTSRASDREGGACAKREAVRAALRACDERRRSASWAPQELQAIERRAPRLAHVEYAPALRRLAKLPFVRPIESWQPNGKGRDALFRSLAAHLLATVPTPAILWNAFHDDHADVLVPLALHVARGGSLNHFVKTSFPIPLTRRMCHDLLKMPAGTPLLEAIRRTQARAVALHPRFFAAWNATRWAQTIGSRAEEMFWSSVIEWLAKGSEYHPDVGALFDYIDHRRREAEGEARAFTMKGRSILAMLRAMREWHGQLTFDQTARATIYAKSGFTELHHSTIRHEDEVAVDEVWRVREILTESALAAEGRQMKHCVYSYAWRIVKGDTSIWSVRFDDTLGQREKHLCTLEVRNDLRRVVQARGRLNRPITAKELQIVKLWAGANGLVVAV